MIDKKGRPRRYRLDELSGFRDPGMGRMAAGLAELSDRVLDQLSDLPPGAFSAMQADSGLSIGALALHLAWAELSWMERIGGAAAPPSLAAAVARGNFANLLLGTKAAAPSTAAPQSAQPASSTAAPGGAEPAPASTEPIVAPAATPFPGSVDDYRRLYADLRSGLTLPVLRSIADIHAEKESKGILISPAGVMAHLAWHWSYHSGHIGLLRMSVGYDYSWTFDAEVTLSH